MPKRVTFKDKQDSNLLPPLHPLEFEMAKKNYSLKTICFSLKNWKLETIIILIILVLCRTIWKFMRKERKSYFSLS